MFKRTNPFTRSLVTILLIVIALTLLGGTYYAFNPAQADGLASAGTATPDLDPIYTPTPMPLVVAFSDEELEAVAPDTTGMAIMGVFLAAIIIFGIFLGWRRAHPHHKDITDRQKGPD